MNSFFGLRITSGHLHQMGLLDLLFPRRCVSCGRIGKYICPRCFPKIKFIQHQLCPVCGKAAIDGITHPYCWGRYRMDGMFAACHYQGVVKQAIHLLKYRQVSDLVTELSLLLFESYPKTIPKLDLLIPVPLHFRREKERGFNQSFLLAKSLGKKLGIPVKNNILKRIRYTKPQADLKREKRLDNIRNVFVCSQNGPLRGKTIGLVDDVATTFATINECCRVLKQAGAKAVWGIVLAHG